MRAPGGGSSSSASTSSIDRLRPPGSIAGRQTMGRCGSALRPGIRLGRHRPRGGAPRLDGRARRPEVRAPADRLRPGRALSGARRHGRLAPRTPRGKGGAERPPPLRLDRVADARDGPCRSLGRARRCRSIRDRLGASQRRAERPRRPSDPLARRRRRRIRGARGAARPYLRRRGPRPADLWARIVRHGLAARIGPPDAARRRRPAPRTRRVPPADRARRGARPVRARKLHRLATSRSASSTSTRRPARSSDSAPSPASTGGHDGVDADARQPIEPADQVGRAAA